MNDHNVRFGDGGAGPRFKFQWAAHNSSDLESWAHVYVDDVNIINLQRGEHRVTPVQLISNSATTWSSVTVDLSTYNIFIISTCTKDYRNLSSTFMPMSLFLQKCTSASSPVEVSYAREPSNYFGRAYYSGGKLYAMSQSTYDLTVVYGI